MNVLTCHFVTASELFKGCPAIWDTLTSDSYLPFTFGSNNRSMISISRIRDYVDGLCESSMEDVSDEVFDRQKNRVLERLDQTDAVYVDLEN